jgi:hypothetical protein
MALSPRLRAAYAEFGHGETERSVLTPMAMARLVSKLSTVARVSGLAVGDWITEVDTPTGPWYRVIDVTPSTVTVDGRLDDDDDPLPVRMDFAASEAVLRRSS